MANMRHGLRVSFLGWISATALLGCGDTAPPPMPTNPPPAPVKDDPGPPTAVPPAKK